MTNSYLYGSVIAVLFTALTASPSQAKPLLVAPANDGMCKYFSVKNVQTVTEQFDGRLMRFQYVYGEKNCDSKAKISWANTWGEALAYCSAKYPFQAWVDGNRVSINYLDMKLGSSPAYVLLGEFHLYLFVCHGKLRDQVGDMDTFYSRHKYIANEVEFDQKFGNISDMQELEAAIK